MKIEQTLWEFRVRSIMTLTNPMGNCRYVDKYGFKTYEDGYNRLLNSESTSYKDTYSIDEEEITNGIETLYINYDRDLNPKYIQKVYSYCGKSAFVGIDDFILKTLKYVVENYTQQFRNTSNLAYLNFNPNNKTIRGNKVTYKTKMEDEKTFVEQIYSGDLLLWECKFTELI